MLPAVLLLALILFPGQATRDARAIARAIEARYRSAATWKAVFLETYREGRGAIRAESGTLYLLRPGRMRWEYESPEKKLFLVDGKRVWFYVPADHTASRAPVKGSSDWRTPLALLAGKASLGRLCGRLELLPPNGGGAPGESVAEPGNVLLRCTPRDAVSAKREQDAGSRFQEVLVEVDGAYRLVRVKILEPGDVATEIRFGDWQENVPLPEALFRFQPPPGVAIVDRESLGDWSR